MVLVTLVCLLLILIVLMQRPRQEGLGAAFGSGMTDQMFGAQTTNVLQKGTTWLGICYFLLTFILAILVAHQDSKKSNLPKLVDEADKKAVPTSPITTTTPANLPQALEAALKKEEAKAEAEKAAAPATTPPAAPTAPAPESKAPTLTPPAPVPGTAPTPPPAPTPTPAAPAAESAPKTGN
ncbi:MAG: preprotein translocase subunit SecG [Verrucomicrobiota bacterium]